MIDLRTLCGVTSGLVIGVALMIACGDDSPPAVDAATCDCPAGEAPLSGRIRQVTELIPLPAHVGGAGMAPCPEGAILLGGGCSVDAAGGALGLIDAGPRAFPGRISYACAWSSDSVLDNEGRATAICLVPAP